MSMAERKTMTRAVKNPVKRKLTRAEKKEIAAVIQAAKGDGKPHTAQQTIPYSPIGKSRARNTTMESKLAACGRRHALRGDKPLQPQSERSERRRQWVKLP